ncbi:MAG: DUF3343 domain-containing protein [Chitinophagales bacterium]
MTAILLFPSIHQVLRAERVLQQAGVPGSVVPIPRDLATDCGMAWSMPPQGLPEALRTLSGVGLTPGEAWTYEVDGWEKVELDT